MMHTFILAFALLLNPAAAQDGGGLQSLLESLAERIEALEARVIALEEENDSLRERIAELEDAAEPAQSAEPGSGDSSEPGRVMRITRIEQTPIDRALLEQAAELEKQAAALDKRIRRHETRRSEIPERSILRPNAVANQRDRRELGRLIMQDRRDAQRLRGQATALRRDAEASRQIIYGWDGERMVIVETDRDFSAVLSKIGAGGFATWRGRLIGYTEDGAHYRASTIALAEEPQDFTGP